MASVEVLDVVCYGSIVRGHHIYKTIWTPFIGEILTVNHEEDNSYDSCAVAWLHRGDLPWDISEVSWFFLLHGGNISCEITGHQKFRVGLEVPCSYKYTSPPKLIKKLKKRLTTYCTTNDDIRIIARAFIRDLAFISFETLNPPGLQMRQAFIWMRPLYEEIRYISVNFVYCSAFICHTSVT